MSDVPVYRVVLEEILLLLPCILHGYVRDNVLLTAVHDTDESELERIGTAGKNVESVGASVHEVEFCQNTQCSQTSRVDGARELEGVRVGEVDIRRRNSEDDPIV